jgi:hypothetical protein
MECLISRFYIVIDVHLKKSVFWFLKTRSRVMVKEFEFEGMYTIFICKRMRTSVYNKVKENLIKLIISGKKRTTLFC